MHPWQNKSPRQDRQLHSNSKTPGMASGGRSKADARASSPVGNFGAGFPSTSTYSKRPSKADESVAGAAGCSCRQPLAGRWLDGWRLVCAVTRVAGEAGRRQSRAMGRHRFPGRFQQPGAAMAGGAEIRRRGTKIRLIFRRSLRLLLPKSWMPGERRGVADGQAASAVGAVAAGAALEPEAVGKAHRTAQPGDARGVPPPARPWTGSCREVERRADCGHTWMAAKRADRWPRQF
jgi:hypothetical protein